MIKFFSIIIQIFLILFVSLIIINNSFIVSIEIYDFIYSISSSYLFIILLFLLFLLFLLLNFYFKTKYFFNKFKISKKIKNQEKGYNSFVNGMIALANKDYKKAILESNKMSNYLDGSPSLSLLLKSEVYKVEKKFEDLNIVYEKMSKNKSTMNLAYRGMMEQYIQAQDYHHAFIYGEKLFNNNPFIEKIYDALINIISKTNNWQQLIIITEKAYSKKIINKKIYQDNKSIGYYEIAKAKQFSEIKESLIYIKNALNLRKNFPPYVILYIKLLIENKNFNIAKKFLKKVWNENSHPEYKIVISKLAYYLNTEITELAKYIIAGNYETENSRMLLVEASISSKKWDEARNQIKNLIDVKPKKEVCLLMAKIEEGDSNDIQKIKSWQLRSKNGANSDLWVCMVSKRSQFEWSSVSDSGYFNSLEWKQPFVLKQIQDNNNTVFYDN